MFRKLILLIALLIGAVAPAGAFGSVLTFDDNGAGVNTLGPAYGGFTFGPDWGTVDDTTYALYGNTYGAPSASNAAFNWNGVVSVGLTSGADFDFDGAYFTGWAAGNTYASFTSTAVTVEGWDDGLMVYSTGAFGLSASSYTWLAAGFASVDELRFKNDGSGSRWWLMDNFTFNSGSVVPEPSTIAIWGLGMGCMGLVALRRRRR